MLVMPLSFLLVAIGLAVLVLGPQLTTAGKGSSKVLGFGLTFLGVVIALMNVFVVISAGEVGVQHFLGQVSPTPLEQGVHVINPFAAVERMSIREQSFPPGDGVARIRAQTSDQRNVSLEVAILYRIEAANAPTLYRTIGTEAHITSQIILNSVRIGVRDAVATKSFNEIFSLDRREVASAMQNEIQAKAGDRINVLEVFWRDVTEVTGR